MRGSKQKKLEDKIPDWVRAIGALSGVNVGCMTLSVKRTQAGYFLI